MYPANGRHWCILYTKGSINSRRRQQLSKNVISSTCFGMQRDGPHWVVTCAFLRHVSMHRNRLCCVICRCRYRCWLAQPQTLLQSTQGEKSPCHVITWGTLVPMLMVSQRYTHGSRPNTRRKVAALLLHDQQDSAQSPPNQVRFFVIFLSPYWQFPRDRRSNWAMRPLFQTLPNELIKSYITIWCWLK
jgi:hypothetical protein